jgi:hypothetical protein
MVMSIMIVRIAWYGVWESKLSEFGAEQRATARAQSLMYVRI